MENLQNTVRAYWCDHDSWDPESSGWFVEVYDNDGNLLEHSQQVWWAGECLNLESFRENHHMSLRKALEDIYPGHEVEICDEF